MANTFAKDLLDRCVVIQKGISNEIKFARPRFWEPIGNNPFPGFFNHVNSVQPDPTSGLPLRVRVHQVEMRLIVGSVANAYKGEHEDKANELFDEILDAFDRQRRLGYKTLEPLRYVTSALLQPVTGGIQPFDYTEAVGSPLFYLGIPFILNVTAQFNVGRES
jgi:hypothetical protein